MEHLWTGPIKCGNVHVHADHGWERCAIDLLHCVAAALNAFNLWIHNNGMHVTGLGNAERGVSLVWEPGVCSDRGWEYLGMIIFPQYDMGGNI